MNHLTSEQQALLILIRQSMWGEAPGLPAEVNWETVDASAEEQGVISLACDGAIAGKAGIPEEILRKWNKKMLHGVLNNERLLSAQSKLVSWFAEAGIPAVVLKGSSVARYYPQPELRVLGDIDVLVNREDVPKAREILERNGYVFHESDHEFHLSFSKPGVYVELHYNVTKIPNSAGGRITGEETARFLEEIDEGAVTGHVFPVLSEPNQALSLLLHMIRHMFTTGIGLRQLCDWAVYAASADPDVLRNATLPLLERCGLLQYAKAATRTCVRCLGLPERNMAWCDDVGDDLCREFIDFVFFRGNMGTASKEGIGNMLTGIDTIGTGQSSMKALLGELTKLAYMHFPFTERYKFLLPAFWVYLPLRYMVRSMLGRRRKQSVVKVARLARQQRGLYDTLKLFEIDE